MPKLSDTQAGVRYGAHLSAKGATATGAALAVTINSVAGVVTTESLSTAAAAEATYVITNNKIAATDIVLVSIGNGTNTTVAPAVCAVTPAAGSVSVSFTNVHASSALNGTLKISFIVIRPN